MSLMASFFLEFIKHKIAQMKYIKENLTLTKKDQKLAYANHLIASFTSVKGKIMD